MTAFAVSFSLWADWQTAVSLRKGAEGHCGPSCEGAREGPGMEDAILQRGKNNQGGTDEEGQRWVEGWVQVCSALGCAPCLILPMLPLHPPPVGHPEGGPDRSWG